MNYASYCSRQQAIRFSLFANRSTGMNPGQKNISRHQIFLQIHFADGVTYKRITLAETLSNESLVRVLDKDKQ
jgi:hypothetical protein